MWLVGSDNISVWTERRGQAFESRLGFELDQGNVLAGEAVVAHPLRVDLLRQEVERRLRQPGAHAVEPKVAAGFAQDRLGRKNHCDILQTFSHYSVGCFKRLVTWSFSWTSFLQMPQG